MYENDIVSEISTDDSVTDILVDEPAEAESGSEDMPGTYDTVSGGDSIVYMLDNSVSEELLMSISDDVQLLVEGSTDGYLSSSIVAVFDRVINSMDYKYYVAYRGSQDSSDGYLYLSNEINGNTLYDCSVIHMYRSYVSQDVGYQYYYQVVDDSAESFNFNNGALYYTNVVPDFPTLGSPLERHILDWIPIFSLVILVCSFFIRRKVKTC